MTGNKITVLVQSVLLDADLLELSVNVCFTVSREGRH